MLAGSRVFVLVLFTILGLSFIAETAVLISEFADAGWFMFLTHDSHLFLFFPTFGIVALAAFSTPAAAFVDMYWRHVALGRLRFTIGFLALAALSWFLAVSLSESPLKAMWHVAPGVLLADKSEPQGCGGPEMPCERLALLEAAANVSTVSHARMGLAVFERECPFAPLLEAEPATERKRFCFASTPLTDKPHLSGDAECCKAQERLQKSIIDLHEPEAQRSLTGKVHDAVLPLKVFFLLMLFVMSILLAVRHDGVTRHYPEHIARIELGVLVGAIAMVFFPLMSQAFAETANVLYGVNQRAGFKPIVPYMSFAFGAWALLLLLFFYHRHNQQMEVASKLAGVAASAIAVVKYDLLVALVVRFLGSGADAASIAVLILLALVSVMVLLSRSAVRLLSEMEGTLQR